MTPILDDPGTRRYNFTTLDKIHDMSLTDQRITQWFIATELGISQNELQMTNVLACWVPKLQQHVKVQSCHFCGRSQDISQGICNHEIGVHHYQRDERTIKATEIPSLGSQESQTGEVCMKVIVFWDAKGLTGGLPTKRVTLFLR